MPSPILELDPSIFRAYDIRGIAGANLTDEVAYWVGRAVGARCLEENEPSISVGGDGRASSPTLAKAMMAGLCDAGIDVRDVGMVPTPALYFTAVNNTGGSGVMITGSHNPPEYNGLKMMVAGATLAEKEITALHDWIDANAGADPIEPRGSIQPPPEPVLRTYVDAIVDNVSIARPLKVVVDSGNGVGGLVARDLFERIGCEVVSLFDDVDPTFPNHHPDPAEPENLADLQHAVVAEGADVGIAFDGDADRLGVVSGTGRVLWPDVYLMHFAESVLPHHPGAPVVFDVKCTAQVRRVIERSGGVPIMWKTGHSHMKTKRKDVNAPVAGEFSGHICFGDRWNGMDDAPYAGARFVESLAETSVDDILDRYPPTVTTPEIKIATTDEDKFAIVEALKRDTSFGGGTITLIDGIRVDFDDGWGLLRASNTSPVLTLRFEAVNDIALERIRTQFNQALSAVAPALANARDLK